MPLDPTSSSNKGLNLAKQRPDMTLTPDVERLAGLQYGLGKLRDREEAKQLEKARREEERRQQLLVQESDLEVARRQEEFDFLRTASAMVLEHRKVAYYPPHAGQHYTSQRVCSDGRVESLSEWFMMLGDTEYVGLTTIIVLFITLVWFMTFGLSLFPHAPETYLSYSMIGVALAGAGLRLWGQLARRFAWKIVSDVRQASPEILRDMRELVKSTESDIQLLTTEPCDHTEEDASLPTCV